MLSVLSAARSGTRIPSFLGDLKMSARRFVMSASKSLSPLSFTRNNVPKAISTASARQAYIVISVDASTENGASMGRKQGKDLSRLPMG